jgi:hypothetical protein
LQPLLVKNGVERGFAGQIKAWIVTRIGAT